MTMKTCNTKPLKSKRGRPKGSKNKTKMVNIEDAVILISDEDSFTPKKRRGRPPKKKPEQAGHYDLDESDEDIDEEVNHRKTTSIWDDDSHEPEEQDEEEEEFKEIKKRTIDRQHHIKNCDDKPDKKKYYVDTKRLEYLIEQYNEDEIIVDELAIALYNISNRMSFSPNFINYSWKDEMIGDGLVKQFRALKNKKYDPAKGKAFSYFSMIVFNAFCNKIKTENKNNEILKAYQSEQYDTLVFEESNNNENNNGEDYD